MNSKLSGKKIAVLMTDGFEEVEYVQPREALEQEGAQVVVISPKNAEVKAWDGDHWGNTYSVDQQLENSNSSDFDALLLPGGVMNPDNMRGNKKAIHFIKDFLDQKKPIAAICHAPQLFTETGNIQGRKLTSYQSVQTDLKNAGAQWVDEEVVVDNGLVTSRSPSDIPAFNAKMVEEFCEGRHEQRAG